MVSVVPRWPHNSVELRVPVWSCGSPWAAGKCPPPRAKPGPPPPQVDRSTAWPSSWAALLTPYRQSPRGWHHLGCVLIHEKGKSPGQKTPGFTSSDLFSFMVRAIRQICWAALSAFCIPGKPLPGGRLLPQPFPGALPPCVVYTKQIGKASKTQNTFQVFVSKSNKLWGRNDCFLRIPCDKHLESVGCKSDTFLRLFLPPLPRQSPLMWWRIQWMVWHVTVGATRGCQGRQYIASKLVRFHMSSDFALQSGGGGRSLTELVPANLPF